MPKLFMTRYVKDELFSSFSLPPPRVTARRRNDRAEVGRTWGADEPGAQGYADPFMFTIKVRFGLVKSYSSWTLCT